MILEGRRLTAAGGEVEVCHGCPSCNSRIGGFRAAGEGVSAAWRVGDGTQVVDWGLFVPLAGWSERPVLVDIR